MNYVKALEAAALDTNVEKEEVVAILEDKINSKTATVVKDDQVTPNDFVNEFLSKHRSKFTFNDNWTMIQQCGEIGQRQLTLDELCQFAIGYNENVTHYKLSADSIRRALCNTKAEKMMTGVDTTAKRVIYDASCEKTLNNVLDFCYKWWKIREDKEIFFTLMKQWMWQVKRYLFNRKVRYHIWLNFMGASGQGKTEWIKMYCKPFEDVYAQCQVDVLFDSSREIKKFTDNYILNFDELARQNNNTYTDTASASDMAIIKALLTAEIFETRIMGGQTQMKAKRSFSVISSSNNHLYDTFYDPSTMRRYFEFNCQVVNIKDFTPINKCMTFMEKAWKGIDENNDDGYFDPNSDIGFKIAEIQSTYYPTNTTVHAWLEELTNEEKSYLSTQTTNEVYQSYKTWCEQERCHSKTRKNFIESLKHYDSSLINETKKEVVEDEPKFVKLSNEDMIEKSTTKSKIVDALENEDVEIKTAVWDKLKKDNIDPNSLTRVQIQEYINDARTERLTKVRTESKGSDFYENISH